MTDSPHSPPPRAHIPLYDDVLKVVEVWIVLALLLLVVASTFLNILDRNFQLGLWDFAVIEKMIFSGVFYIGMFGGVIAARRAKHIAIDGVTHFLRPRPRRVLATFMYAVSALTCAVLAVACYDWMQTILTETSSLVPGRDEWWLRTRLWRWPVVVAFAWMALHFFVNAGRALAGVVRPPAIAVEPDRGANP